MSKRNPIVKKIAPELDAWLKARQMNMQKLLPYGKISQIETQRIIAQTDGVEITPDLVKRMRKRFG